MMQDWRSEKRNDIEARISASTPGDVVAHSSPRGRYELAITQRHNEQGWSYSEGVATGSKQGHIATVRRNFAAFSFLFAEDHPTGHDYLIGGETAGVNFSSFCS